MPTRPEVPHSKSRIATVVAGAVFVATLVSLPVIAGRWNEISTTLRDAVADIPRLQASAQQQVGSGSESLLVIVPDEARRIRAIALLAVGDDVAGSLSVIPPGLFELLPGYGDFTVGDAMAFEGPELARITVANALGVRVDRVAVLEPGRIAGALSSPVAVELNEPVLVDAGSGMVQLADAGEGSYDGAIVEQLMVDNGESSQISWLERQSSVWRSLLDRAGEDGTIAARLFEDVRAAATFSRVSASDRKVSLVPVTPVAVAGADDGFQLVQADVAAFVADKLPHIALATGERPRVEVLNGNGEILATRSVVDALVAAGFHVVKTDNAENFAFEETIVIAQGRGNLDAAENAAGTLGVRSVQLELIAPSGVVDVSIIVGQDIATLRS